MGNKNFSLIIPVILLVALILVPLSKVKAQSIVIIALAGIGFGQDEKAEVYWYPTTSPPDHTPTDRVIFNYNYFFNVTMTWPPTSPGDEACTEAVQTIISGRSGLNILTLEMGAGNDSLLINGQPLYFRAGTCLQDAKRVAVQIGRKIPPDMAQRIAADPSAAQGLSLNEIWGWTSVNSDESTAASSVSPWGTGYQFGDTDFLEP